jgi:hypothetical protein
MGLVMSAQLTLNFDHTDPAEANVLCGELQDSLRRDVPDAEVSRFKSDPLTQDFGATLVLVLGSAAVTALAKGIAAWLATRHEAELRLTRTNPDGSTKEIVVNGQLGSRAHQVITDFLTDEPRSD